MDATHDEPRDCSSTILQARLIYIKVKGTGSAMLMLSPPSASELRHAPPGRNAAIAIALHVRHYQACGRWRHEPILKRCMTCVVQRGASEAGFARFGPCPRSLH